MRKLAVLSSLSVWLLLSVRMAAAQDPVSLLLAAPAGIEMISEYLGIIESMDAKFERLIDADLKTAVALFEQAKASPNKSAELIHSARIYYTRAAEIQSDSMDEDRRHKRALALLGLFACCKVEQDNANAERALRKISEIPKGVSVSFKIKCELKRPGTYHPVFQFFQKQLTEEDYRKASPAYNSLLSIQETVNQQLAKLTQEQATTKR
ncbi:MAG: hypothetical protein ACKO2L_14660 [Planctomycetaceae bacterium]